MESGFDGYMPKPINANLLKVQLKDIMQKRIILLYNPQIEMFARFKMKSSFHKTKRII